MTKEDKELLFKDLCARLYDGVKIKTLYGDAILVGIVNCKGVKTNYIDIITDKYLNPIEHIRPYLRPMSSMTKEEVNTFMEIFSNVSKEVQNDALLSTYKVFDFCNAKHLDYRGLIPKGLAIAVTKENNPYKN